MKQLSATARRQQAAYLFLIYHSISHPLVIAFPPNPDAGISTHRNQRRTYGATHGAKGRRRCIIMQLCGTCGKSGTGCITRLWQEAYFWLTGGFPYSSSSLRLIFRPVMAKITMPVITRAATTAIPAIPPYNNFSLTDRFIIKPVCALRRALIHQKISRVLRLSPDTHIYPAFRCPIRLGKR